MSPVEEEYLESIKNFHRTVKKSDMFEVTGGERGKVKLFCKEYYHTKTYFDFEVEGELPKEGILKGKAGEFHFRLVSDGIAVYDSTLLTSGFVYPGSPNDIFVPRSVNGIPVVELHQTVYLKSKHSFSIENGGIKRLFLNIGVQSLEEQMGKSDNPLGVLLLYMLREKEEMNQSEKMATINFDFCGNQIQQVEYCSISCNSSIVLFVPKTKELSVNAQKVVLRGDIPACVEKMSISGKIYPFYEPSWECDVPNNHCFDGLEKLESIEGSLSGKDGWSFRGCSSLKSVHLSNGIEKIPKYAFQNCTALRDIYIPDTVASIGEYSFSGCASLQTIHLPSSMKTIPRGMFQGCRSIKKVFLSDDIEVIEDYAFAGCTSLLKPWIPKNIKHIGENAFDDPLWSSIPW